MCTVLGSSGKKLAEKKMSGLNGFSHKRNIKFVYTYFGCGTKVAYDLK
jgi:hypothetical protein